MCLCCSTWLDAAGGDEAWYAMSPEMTFKLLDDVDRGCTCQMVELEEITKIVHSHKVTFSILLK